MLHSTEHMLQRGKKNPTIVEYLKATQKITNESQNPNLRVAKRRLSKMEIPVHAFSPRLYNQLDTALLNAKARVDWKAVQKNGRLYEFMESAINGMMKRKPVY